MKISELIEGLEILLAERGDVGIWHYDGSGQISMDNFVFEKETGRVYIKSNYVPACQKAKYAAARAELEN